jgi:hypothetical protein
VALLLLLHSSLWLEPEQALVLVLVLVPGAVPVQL